jgi:hypothetical protein
VKLLPLVEFTIHSTINRAMGMALFEICGGLLPRMMQDLPLAECIPPGVRTFTIMPFTTWQSHMIALSLNECFSDTILILTSTGAMNPRSNRGTSCTC